MVSSKILSSTTVFEGSCDTEDVSSNILQYYCFYCIIYQINAVSYHQKSYQPQFFLNSTVHFTKFTVFEPYFFYPKYTQIG